ncbi:MAG: acetyl-CoA carboxylase biotin carboxylase subunit [Acidobacteriia bacterium]|nr:acetyl-CoA carboxylase biotin carboxylase subunit [Terriglobia bacterium]
MVFKKILIANRGEIAVRVIRACREMGIPTVAVYSERDRASLHVRMADEAVLIGPPSASESYLSIDKIVAAAKKTEAEAIHPGYGFLSENADFAEACEQGGIVFIGPPASAMQLMGSKISARAAMKSAGVPIVPGTIQPILDDHEACAIAREIGFPVMVKAAAGGGGKGLRLVINEAEMESAVRTARSEALNAFHNDAIYIEKFLDQPRHIEIQILADAHGHVVYLGERECSIQRRHQKVMEETPSTFINDSIRLRMGEAAVSVGRACGYVNAGTVEFLVDSRKDFYFLEMNTRLQVEHPITEWVTGIDLVKEQISIAAGEALHFSQEDIHPRGAAIECRIYAEDPYNHFYPSPGRLTVLGRPAGPGVRIDSGAYEGWDVPLEYDPLLAKLSTWGTTREEAIGRLRRALLEYEVLGIQTGIPFYQKILRHPDFLSGNYDTGFIDKVLREESIETDASPAFPPGPLDEGRLVALMAASVHAMRNGSSPKFEPTTGEATGSRWKWAGRKKIHEGKDSR